MKKFILKNLIISLNIFLLSLLILPIIQVGDTILNESTAVNYNGYIPKKAEELLIEYGFLSYSLNDINGYIYYSLNDSDLTFLEANEYFILYDVLWVDYENVLTPDYVQKVTIKKNYDDTIVVAVIYNGVEYTYNYLEANIQGYSNYEVE